MSTLIKLTQHNGEPIFLNPAGIISVGLAEPWSDSTRPTRIRIWGRPSNVMQNTVEIYVTETPEAVAALVENTN